MHRTVVDLASGETRIVQASEAEQAAAAAAMAAELPAVKRTYAAMIDQDAEAARLQHITPGTGMAMVYQEKFAQAQGVAALGEAAANAMTQAEREAQFPTLAASVGIEAPTLWACAQIVLERYAQFAALSLVIERARLSGKAAIAAATTAAEARAAYEAVTWTP